MDRKNISLKAEKKRAARRQFAGGRWWNTVVALLFVAINSGNYRAGHWSRLYGVATLLVAASAVISWAIWLGEQRTNR